MIETTRLRVGGVVTVDLGIIAPLENIQRRLRELDIRDVRFHQRKPEYFHSSGTRPPLRVSPKDSTQITDCEPDSYQPQYEDRVEQARLNLQSAGFELEYFISSSGIGGIFFLISIEKSLDTTEIIDVTNVAVKYNTLFQLRSGDVFTIEQSIQYLRELVDVDVYQERSGISRRYSIIHLVGLHNETKNAADESNTSLYKYYENQFHALSVRTIEDWQERYPEGLEFSEGNMSLAPSGVLKVNMRNTVIYEYPYDRVEIEELYYPALIEIRIWDLLVTVQLQEAGKALSAYERGEFHEVTEDVVRRIQQRAVRTFNELNSYYLATSKRVRNLFTHAYEVFDIYKLQDLLEQRIDRLDTVVQKIDNLSAKRKQREITSQQRDLLLRQSEEEERSKATHNVLNLATLLVGLLVSLSIADSFNLQSPWRIVLLSSFGGLFGIFYLYGKLRQRTVSFKSRREVQMKLHDIDVDEAVDHILSNEKNDAVQRVSTYPDGLSFIYRRKNLTSTVWHRVEITFGLIGTAEEFNTLVTVESQVSLHWRWQSRKQAKSIAQASIEDILDMISGSREVVAEKLEPIEVKYSER